MIQKGDDYHVANAYILCLPGQIRDAPANNLLSASSIVSHSIECSTRFFAS